MNYINLYVEVLKKFGDFKTRSTRAEFWVFVLVNIIVSVLIGLISQNLSYIYSLVVLVPSLAVGARRLHDIGKSGWLQLLGLIPLIGAIVLIIWWAQEGHQETNKWGDVPASLDV